MQREAEEIARGLSAKQREAVVFLGPDYAQGPDLPEIVIDCLFDLRNDELVERQFYDMAPARTSCDRDSITVRLGACWHFRLTPLGLAVRDVLRREGASATR